MKTFLICPVRGMSPDAHKAAVELLEADGFEVYWPPRDTDQDDSTGLRICCDNAEAITNADVVHIIWDGKSQGCLFDLGVAFAHGKQIIPIDLPHPTEGKSLSRSRPSAWRMQSQDRTPDVKRVSAMGNPQGLQLYTV